MFLEEDSCVVGQGMPEICLNNNSVQFSSYLFACQLNSLRASYRVSSNERKKETQSTNQGKIMIIAKVKLNHLETTVA
jgi:hypothetical protein